MVKLKNKSFIAIFTFIMIICTVYFYSKNFSPKSFSYENQEYSNNIIAKKINSKTNTSNVNTQENICEEWYLEIPKINLFAKIAEGTEEKILNEYIGHFKETTFINGNVGLAAHNRGYEVNYFQDLKLLKKGDEIKYKYNEFEKVYEVEKCRIIKDTDWEYLENTEDNRLTLITCVENQPEYRRCIQAVEKKEEKY